MIAWHRSTVKHRGIPLGHAAWTPPPTPPGIMAICVPNTPLSGMVGDSASVAKLPPTETLLLKSCREIARKHLDNGIRSLFHEIAGVELQVTWLSTWPHRWSDGDLPAVCSWCSSHGAANLVLGGELEHNDIDPHHSAGALKPEHEPNFSRCKLGVRHQLHPVTVRGRILGFLFIQTMDGSEKIPDDQAPEPAGDCKATAPKSTCCPPTALVARPGRMQSERAGMLLKLVATHVESATLAELNEAALSKTRLEALELRPQENSWPQTPLHGLPNLPAKNAKRQASPHHQQIVQRILDYLQSNYHRPIQLGDVAEAVKMNTCYLSSLFSATTGVTYHRYLEGLRLAKAKELLADPVMQICEVASATGFANAGTFCRTFKVRTGLSPRAWRDAKQKKYRHSMIIHNVAIDTDQHSPVH